MTLGQPSRTAFAAAAHRAVHQILEDGRIFSDPLALPILGRDPEELVREAQGDPNKRRMRLFIAVRTHFAEQSLANAVAGGVRQLVVLGAGLDTFAYRNPLGDRLLVFEVDHPATQAWKRQRLAEAVIAIPSSLTFVPIDFERETLEQGLVSAGFNPTLPTFFTWLGVVPYLTEEAIWSTLAFIAGLPNGGSVVFDYSDPPESFAEELKALHDERAKRVEALGEPWITHFEPATLHSRLRDVGFGNIEDLGPPQIFARYFPNQAADSIPSRGGHVLLAATA